MQARTLRISKTSQGKKHEYCIAGLDNFTVDELHDMQKILGMQAFNLSRDLSYLVRDLQKINLFRGERNNVKQTNG